MQQCVFDEVFSYIFLAFFCFVADEHANPGKTESKGCELRTAHCIKYYVV